MKKVIAGSLLAAGVAAGLFGAQTASATTPEEICAAISGGQQSYQNFVMGKLEAGENPRELARIDVQAQREVCPQ